MDTDQLNQAAEHTAEQQTEQLAEQSAEQSATIAMTREQLDELIKGAVDSAVASVRAEMSNNYNDAVSSLINRGIVPDNHSAAESAAEQPGLQPPSTVDDYTPLRDLDYLSDEFKERHKQWQ